MDLLPILEAFFQNEAPLAPEDRVVVAFSGGLDSTALLWGISRFARARGLQVVAAHLDHGLDGGSAGRAAAAARLAVQLNVPLVLARRSVAALRRSGEGPEAAARRLRYAFLEEVRDQVGARYVATAHHRDDQAETVLLRLLFGSGLAGLAGIRPVHGKVVRPLLAVPRAGLAAAVRSAGLSPVEDPTNLDLGPPRNRVRHRLLPRLAGAAKGGKDARDAKDAAGLAQGLAGLAERARRAGLALERRLERFLVPVAIPGGIAVERLALARLPEELLPFALAALHRRAGAPYPASAAARAELLRQLGCGARTACDCGGGWRWQTVGGVGEERLLLRRAAPGEDHGRVSDFTYTLEAPGELEIPEIAARIRLTRGLVEPWMRQGAPHRAGLALPLAAGGCVTVRNRRPGDRLQPLGVRGSRRLKEVLIDHRVPRWERERIPLLCVGGEIAWVPGVTIDHRFRLAGEPTAWIAEIVMS